MNQSTEHNTQITAGGANHTTNHSTHTYLLTQVISFHTGENAIHNEKDNSSEVIHLRNVGKTHLDIEFMTFAQLPLKSGNAETNRTRLPF